MICGIHACRKFLSLHLKDNCHLIMSEYIENEPTTPEEAAKFVKIIESVISNCEALCSEQFDGQDELRYLLSTIGLTEFTSGSKRVHGSLTLNYDRYKGMNDTTQITHLCSGLWHYTNPNYKRDAQWDVFTQITHLKIKYKSNSSLFRLLDSLHMSLMCFVQTNQVYLVTRELTQTRNILKGELERTKTELAETKEELQKNKEELKQLRKDYDVSLQWLDSTDHTKRVQLLNELKILV